MEEKPGGIRLAVVAVCFLVASMVVRRLVGEIARWSRVSLGTRHVPMAPGCHWLLGHVKTLASGCGVGAYVWMGQGMSSIGENSNFAPDWRDCGGSKGSEADIPGVFGFYL